MGPFDGGVPGLVRRVRRILDVSQRGLAAMLGVSQSVVARWETGRTSPRVSVLQKMLRLAGDRGRAARRGDRREVEPMRADGARQRGGSRYPAHADLRVTGWWVPREPSGEMTTIDYFVSDDRSRGCGDPAVHYRTCPRSKRIERMLYGTPVRPSRASTSCGAEAEHLDDGGRPEARPWTPPRHAA